MSQDVVCPGKYVLAPPETYYNKTNVFITKDQAKFGGFVSSSLCLGPVNASFKFKSDRINTELDTSKPLICEAGTPLKSNNGNYYCALDLNKL
jgi:hypothetical protein